MRIQQQPTAGTNFEIMADLSFLRNMQSFAYAAVFIALFVAEHIYPQRRELMDGRHDLINIGIGLLNIVVVGAVGYFFQQYMTWVNAHRLGLLNWLALPDWLRYGIEFLLVDALMYWWHRANHRFGLLWRFHTFHHLDEKLNTTTALRFHVVELLLSFVARAAFFLLAGVSIAGFLIYSLVFTSVVLFQHSSVRLPLRIDLALRRILVTPHMHRIHHSVRFEETDSNFSSVFSFWDMVFGTYCKLPEGPVTFGLPKAHKNTPPITK